MSDKKDGIGPVELLLSSLGYLEELTIVPLFGKMISIDEKGTGLVQIIVPSKVIKDVKKNQDESSSYYLIGIPKDIVDSIKGLTENTYNTKEEPKITLEEVFKNLENKENLEKNKT